MHDHQPPPLPLSSPPLPLHYWAVVMLSIKMVQEWEEACKQAAAENRELEHDADARLVAAHQEHVTSMKDAELWNWLEVSMAEEHRWYQTKDVYQHYIACLRI